MINKIKTPLVTLIISMIIFLGSRIFSFSFGKIINKYFPCEQNPIYSFPCFGIYDIYFLFFLIGVFILSLIVICYKIYKNKKH
jgi:hypothetical protein